MRSSRVVLGLVCVALVSTALFSVVARADDGGIRIGTYDSRAIAIAYARSAYLPLVEKTREFDLAEAAGDTVKMHEINDFMEALQRQLHRQGFSRAPVDDLLEPVAHMMPGLAAERGVDAIVWFCDYVGEGVEIVDVTMDLVGLCDPTAETLDMCSKLGSYEPVSLDELDHDH